jgi:hypothetical protein
VRAAIGDADDREHLRHHDRGGDALPDAREDERVGFGARPHDAEVSVNSARPIA